MIRWLLLSLMAYSPAQADGAVLRATLLSATEIASERAERLQTLVAPKGILTSRMTPDGHVEVMLRDATTRNIRLDFIGAFDAGECLWALQFRGLENMSLTRSMGTQAALIGDGWPTSMTDTTDTLTAAECIARSSLTVLDDGCVSMLPLTVGDTIFHFAVNLPELCE